MRGRVRGDTNDVLEARMLKGRVIPAVVNDFVLNHKTRDATIRGGHGDAEAVSPAPNPVRVITEFVG